MTSKEAKPDTWMPLVIGDYLKDTARLTTEQHGAYLLIIMDYWVNGAPPDDDAELAAIAHLEVRAWRKHRDKLARFFRIEEGRWRHKRVEEELARWADRKAKYIERAAAGGRAKAAKSSASSSASSTTKALLKGCLKAAPQPASTEVGAATLAPTLSGEFFNLGPKEVREEFVAKLGEDWVRSYLDPCGWQDMPERGLRPATAFAADKIRREARALLTKHNLAILERAA